MDKTILNIKTDKELKEKAQQTARELGLPLGTIINSYLRELTREKRVVFSVPPEPNQKLRIILRKIRSEKGKRKRSAKPLNYEQAIDYLNNL